MKNKHILGYKIQIIQHPTVGNVNFNTLQVEW